MWNCRLMTIMNSYSDCGSRSRAGKIVCLYRWLCVFIRIAQNLLFTTRSRMRSYHQNHGSQIYLSSSRRSWRVLMNMSGLILSVGCVLKRLLPLYEVLKSHADLNNTNLSAKRKVPLPFLFKRLHASTYQPVLRKPAAMPLIDK